jgi:hypothetical protein
MTIIYLAHIEFTRNIQESGFKELLTQALQVAVGCSTASLDGCGCLGPPVKNDVIGRASGPGVDSFRRFFAARGSPGGSV